MKRSLKMMSILFGLMLFTRAVAGPGNAYTTTMRSLIAQLDTVESAAQNLKLANAFARIAETE